MTITLRGVSKRFARGGVESLVADRIDAVFPAGRTVGLLGRNGAGKSTLLRMIAGLVPPDAGQIERQGSVSWPVGFAGSFHGDLTGAENIRFVARVYGVDTDALVAYAADFAELGPHLNAPFRTYSSGMRARLAFGVSMGVPFDTYLVDEVTAVGDALFRAKSEAVLADRLTTRGAIVVSHSLQMIARLCDAGAVLADGRLEWFDDIGAAIDRHRHLLGVAETAS